MDKKTPLRLKAKQIRNNLDIVQKSDSIVSRIKKSEIYKNAQNIMIYYPLEHEINVLNLTNDTHKNFYLPRMNGKELECCPYTKSDTLKKGKFNIQEPKTECILCPNLDLIIIPALAADKNGNRLGYGGGFYDRFLKKGNWKKLVVLPQELVFDEIPAEEFDVKVNYIVTDKEVCIII